MLRFSDIPKLQEFLCQKREEIAMLKRSPATPENLARVLKITEDAKTIENDIKELRGNMYPYAE